MSEKIPILGESEENKSLVNIDKRTGVEKVESSNELKPDFKNLTLEEVENKLEELKREWAKGTRAKDNDLITKAQEEILLYNARRKEMLGELKKPDTSKEDKKAPVEFIRLRTRTPGQIIPKSESGLVTTKGEDNKIDDANPNVKSPTDSDIREVDELIPKSKPKVFTPNPMGLSGGEISRLQDSLAKEAESTSSYKKALDAENMADKSIRHWKIQLKEAKTPIDRARAENYLNKAKEELVKIQAEKFAKENAKDKTKVEIYGKVATDQAPKIAGFADESLKIMAQTKIKREMAEVENRTKELGRGERLQRKDSENLAKLAKAEKDPLETAKLEARSRAAGKLADQYAKEIESLKQERIRDIEHLHKWIAFNELEIEKYPDGIVRRVSQEFIDEAMSKMSLKGIKLDRKLVDKYKAERKAEEAQKQGESKSQENETTPEPAKKPEAVVIPPQTPGPKVETPKPPAPEKPTEPKVEAPKKPEEKVAPAPASHKEGPKPGSHESPASTYNYPNSGHTFSASFESAASWLDYLNTSTEEKLAELESVPDKKRGKFMKLLRSRFRYGIKQLKAEMRATKDKGKKKEVKMKIKQERDAFREFNRGAYKRKLLNLGQYMNPFNSANYWLKQYSNVRGERATAKNHPASTPTPATQQPTPAAPAQTPAPTPPPVSVPTPAPAKPAGKTTVQTSLDQFSSSTPDNKPK